MSGKQQKRAQVLCSLCGGGISSESAAELMGLSRRQTRRLKARFRKEQFQAVMHGNQGRTPRNRTDPELIEQLRQLCGEGGKYSDFNTSHLHELLLEQEGISIGRSTLDRVLKEIGLRRRRGVRRVIRKRRERKEAEGMMLQIDGSPHDWLEGRGPMMALIGAIDDATGKIIYARFRDKEDQAGYLMLLRETVRRYGIPMSIYHDRHTILVSPKEPTVEEQVAGLKPMSQVQRVMEQLGIETIGARSAQGKGRVERLWGTLQDRLTKEMRLSGINTLEEANAFLPGFILRYNSRFAVAPQCKEAAWVEVPQETDWTYLFSVREQRKVQSDHTVGWLGQILQILPGSRSRSLAGEAVHVHVTPEREIYLYYGKKRLEYRRIQEPSVVRSARSNTDTPVDAANVASTLAGAAETGSAPQASSAPHASPALETLSKLRPSDRKGSRSWLFGHPAPDKPLADEEMLDALLESAGSTSAPAVLEQT